MELICIHCLPEQHQIYRNMYQCTSCTLSCYSVHYPRFRTVQNILNGIDNWHGLCRVSEFRGNSGHRLFFRKPHHSRWQNTKTWHLKNFWNAISAISGYSNLNISQRSLPARPCWCTLLHISSENAKPNYTKMKTNYLRSCYLCRCKSFLKVI